MILNDIIRAGLIEEAALEVRGDLWDSVRKRFREEQPQEHVLRPGEEASEMSSGG